MRGFLARPICLVPHGTELLNALPAHPFAEGKVGEMENVKRAKEPKGWKGKAELSGVFELVDRVNEHARARSSLFAKPSD